MRRLLSVALVLGCAVAFANGQEPAKRKFFPIVFDDWWNVDYVKNGCELAAKNATPCPADSTPEDTVKEFENELEVAFASESACHGLVLTHLTPAMVDTAVKNPSAKATGTMATVAKEQWWSLILDLDGHSRNQIGQDWSLVDPTRKALNGHITTPHRTIQQICRIAKGVGGKTE